MSDSKPDPGDSVGTKIAGRTKVQVGTWVIPMSGTDARIGHPHEGLHPVNPLAAPSKRKRKRPAPMSIRASNTQRAAIKAKAKSAGVSVNQFLLQQALDRDMAPAKPSPEDRVERACALRACSSTGNLLNQIAKHLNTGRIIGSIDVAAAIKRNEDNTARMLEAFIKGLPR